MTRRAGFFLILIAAVWGARATPARAEDGDTPERGVARISLIRGDVSVRRGDSGDWVAAAINAPLVVKDRIATGAGSRAEVQFDYANLIRLAGDSEVRFTELQNRRYLMQVARGTVTYRVLRNSDAEVEVSTPQASIRPSKKGAYRVTVREDGQTEITARSGEVEIYTPRGVEQLHSGKTMLVRGSAADPEFQLVQAIDRDEWDRWNENRDRDLERSRSYQYVSRDVYGAEDLDGYGGWVYRPAYGWCWRPTVVAGWAPYRYGRWVWMDWYGWTWLSYDPWGWAPYHYGRWYYDAPFGWLWYPGGLYVHPYWRPALVAFFGFGSFSGFHAGFGFGNVGWVPLAPFERFYPWYGRGFYGRSLFIDRSVNIVNNINITNVYRNARVGNAITAVNAEDFSRGRLGSVVRVNEAQVRQAGLVRGALPLAPSAGSLRLADREARVVPRSIEGQRFFSHRQPDAVEKIPFAEQRRSFDGAGAATVARGESLRADHGRSAAGMPPASAPTEAVSRREAVEPGRGWRRFGEPVRSESGIAQRNEGAAPQVRRSEAPAVAPNGWRRFGEPVSRQSPEPGRRAPEASRSNMEVVPRSAERVNRQSEPGQERGWRRFGEPGAVERRPETAAPVNREEIRNRRDPGDSWRQLERRQEWSPRVERRSEATSFGRPESIRIDPPVVRERPPVSVERRMPESRGSFGGGMPRGESRGGGAGVRMESRGGDGGGGRVSRGDGGGGRAGGGGRNR